MHDSGQHREEEELGPQPGGAIHVGADGLGEGALDVAPRPVLAGEVPGAVAAEAAAAADVGRVAPDELGEVAGLVGEARVAKVVDLALVAPGLDARCGVGAPDGQVLAIRATRVRHLARRGVEVVGREVLERRVPPHVGGAVLRPVRIGAVEDGRREGWPVDELGRLARYRGTRGHDDGLGRDCVQEETRGGEDA